LICSWHLFLSIWFKDLTSWYNFALSIVRRICHNYVIISSQVHLFYQRDFLSPKGFPWLLKWLSQPASRISSFDEECHFLIDWEVQKFQAFLRPPLYQQHSWSNGWRSSLIDFIIIMQQNTPFFAPLGRLGFILFGISLSYLSTDAFHFNECDTQATHSFMVLEAKLCAKVKYNYFTEFNKYNEIQSGIGLVSFTISAYSNIFFKLMSAECDCIICVSMYPCVPY
jgi:hypothetical protein